MKCQMLTNTCVGHFREEGVIVFHSTPMRRMWRGADKNHLGHQGGGSGLLKMQGKKLEIITTLSR